ncbi:MAG: hypothetical protein Q8N26_08855 [Myxococcales bacterium]|nr:hypothetical protein [Myxococcales bacterium]
MNVLRSLARELISLSGLDSNKKTGELGLRSALDKRVVPPVVNLSRYRDSFEQLPQSLQGAMHSLRGERATSKANWAPLAMSAMNGASSFQPAAPQFNPHVRDGFDGSRRPPVDLTGGVKPPALLSAEPAPARATGKNGFRASLHDLL